MSEPTLKVEVELAALNAAIPRYQELSRKTPGEVLPKIGATFAQLFFRRLRDLPPVKGTNQIRTERLAALKAGQGIKIRAGALAFAHSKTTATATDIKTRKGAAFLVLKTRGAYKRGQTFREVAVAREIAIRESGIDFLSVSSLYKKGAVSSGDTATDKTGQVLSDVGITGNADGGAVTFSWTGAAGPSAKSALEGLSKPAARAVTALALRDTLTDPDIGMLVYIQRKLDENAKKAGLA